MSSLAARAGAVSRAFVRVLRVTSVLSPLITFGCDGGPPRSTVAPAPAVLGSSVARVTAEGQPPVEVPGVLVQEIARAQGISLAEARDRAVSDVLFALAAQAQHLDAARFRDIDARLAERLAQDFLAEARAQGPATRAELDAVIDKHWWDVRRPESFMSAHAVVMLKADADPADEKKARALADSLREIALGIGEKAKSSPQPGQPMSERVMLDSVTIELKGALRTVSMGDQKVVVEQLPPLARDGKSVIPGLRDPYDPAFVAAVSALSSRGEVSPIVRSPFGLHVIVLIAKYPAKELPDDELRSRFVLDVYDGRARKIADELLGRLHQSVPVEIEKNADALLAQVRFEPTGVPVAVAPAPPGEPSSPPAGAQGGASSSP